eukprot:216431-Pyramimonas_sp.AAC.1
MAVTHEDAATGAFGGALYCGANRVKGVTNWATVAHANAPTGASGGAPYGATNRVRGVLN